MNRATQSSTEQQNGVQGKYGAFLQASDSCPDEKVWNRPCREQPMLGASLQDVLGLTATFSDGVNNCCR